MEYRNIACSLALLLLITSPIAYLQFTFGETNSTRTLTVPNDFSSIQAALDEALAGDTVFVKNGIYNETALKITKPLTLKGQSVSGTQVYLTPTQYPVNDWGRIVMTYNNSIAIQADNVQISGLTFTIVGGDIVALGSNIQIVGNSFNTPSFTILAGNYDCLCGNLISTVARVSGLSNTVVNNTLSGGLIVNGNDSLVSNNYACTMKLSGQRNILANNTIINGLLLANANYNLIVGNFETNGTFGIQVGDTQPNQPSSFNLFVGNTIEYAVLWGVLVGVGDYNAFCANLITLNGGAGHGGYGLAMGGTHITITNNLFFNNIFNSNIKNFDTNWEVSGNNSFDNGTWGNYWDDYNGTQLGDTGIGSTPYFVYGNCYDNHPLITQPSISTKLPTLPQPWASQLADTVALESKTPFPPTQPPTPTPSISSSPTPSSVPTLTPTVIQTQPSTPQPTPTTSPKIPEFPAWLLLPVALIALTAAVAVRRKLASLVGK